MPSYIKSKEIDVIPRFPLQGNFDLTYSCNNNCLHCWIRVPQKSPERQNELNTDEIKAIVDDARKIGCKSWSISGGEPMLRPDFQEIFDYITKKSSSYSINTNGTLITPEIAELMKRKGRKIIALYGATAEVHDHITRNPSSFQATMKGFQLLQEAGAEFIVQIVPMKDNYYQIEEMKELAKSLSPFHRISAPLLFFSSKGDLKRNEEIKLQKFEPRDAIELDKPQLSSEEIGLDECDDFFKYKSFFASCISNIREFHIDPYGYMSFCRFIKDPSFRYDLRQGSFQECWNTFIPSLKNKAIEDQEHRDKNGSCNLGSQCNWCTAYDYLEHRHFSTQVENLCKVAREGRKFEDYWEKNHCRYFKCADITFKMESDLPITEKTFHQTFNPFKIDEPGKNMIIIQYHFGLPYLGDKDMGKLVYKYGSWEVRRKGSSWIYLIYSMISKRVKCIAVSNNDHTRVRIYIDKLTDKEDLNYFHMKNISISYNSLAHVLANRSGFLLHSSGVIIDGKGILFVGHSGAGKSTLRNMALLKEEIKPLCNDKNIVMKWPDGYRIHGVWAHTEFPSEIHATSIPLGAIMFLEQAQEDLIIPLENKLEVIKRLLPCILRPVESTEWWDKTLNIVGEIAQKIPCYRLRFNLSGGIINHLMDITLKLMT